MRSHLRELTCSFVLCASMGAQAWAQASVSPSPAPSAPPASTAAAQTGTISGKVVDGAGRPLGRAHIFISGPTSVQMSANPDGSFNANLPPGIYRITISASGYQTRQIDTVDVFLGEGTNVAATLTNASLTTIATVSATTSNSVSDSASSSTRLSPDVIQNQGQTQVVNVLDQLPGVEVLRVGGGSNEPGANASISIRGAQPYESQILLDGHPVDTIGNGPYGFNTTFTNSILLSGVEAGKGPGNMPNTVTDAVGGSVNFQTAPITSKPSGEIMSQYDSFAGWTYGARYSDTIGKFGFLVGIARETTPGYMAPQDIFGFGRASFFSPYTSPTFPLTGNNQMYPPGTNYVGVLNYNYPATSDFEDHSALLKLAYNFSRDTSLQVSSYTTQTWLDETGNNVGNIYAKIVPCISASPAAPTCTTGPGVVNYNQNWTNQAFAGLIGQTVPINLYAGYPNTYETDSEPITTADLRTVIGPATFLARYYAGSVTRDVIQNNAPTAIGPCFTPTCDWVGNIPGSASASDAFDNGYSGEAYFEETTDVLHGFDAQYNLPFGEANDVTLGFDNHSDSYDFQELYANGWYPPCVTASCAYGLFEPSPQYLKVDSSTESLRGNFLLTPKLQLAFGGYHSNTTYVGSRFDPRVGLTWRPKPNVSVRASAGSAYVTPYQGVINPKSYVSKKTFYPSTQFSAETSMGYDFGVDYRYRRDSIVSADYYSTNIYNRYATVNVVTSGTFQGTPYTSESIPTSQGQTLNQGFEFALRHQPLLGFGYHAAIDLLRDYFYDQTNVSLNNFGGVFLGPLPNNGVQLPGYPFSKMRADLTYAFRGGDTLRFSSTSYGANNSFGRSGFTTYDGAIVMPVQTLKVTVGASNIFNKDNEQTGGLYFGGYTYQALGGGTGPTNFEYAEPRTVFLQVGASIK